MRGKSLLNLPAGGRHYPASRLVIIWVGKLVTALAGFLGSIRFSGNGCLYSVTFLTVFFPVICSSLHAEESLLPEQATSYVGKTKTVCGPVANTYYSCFVSGKPTFINFGKPYPEHVFSITIMGEDRSKFGDCPEKMFEGKNVCVTGLIEEYDGKPLIVVKDQNQIQWLD